MNTIIFKLLGEVSAYKRNGSRMIVCSCLITVFLFMKCFSLDCDLLIELCIGLYAHTCLLDISKIISSLREDKIEMLKGRKFMGYLLEL